MIISAHIVKKPRKEWGCASCRKHPDKAPHVVAYGYAERGDPPYRMRICIDCATSYEAETKLFLLAIKHIGQERGL